MACQGMKIILNLILLFIHQRLHQLEEQKPAHPPLQHHEGEEGEPSHKNVQQAGCPGLLLHLECQIFSWLEQWRLPRCLRAGKFKFLPTPHPTLLAPCHFCPRGPARTPSTSPVLVLCYPWQKGLEPRCGGHPPSPYSSSTSYIYLQVIDYEADALPLLWEFNSGGGVICGASM